MMWWQRDFGKINFKIAIENNWRVLENMLSLKAHNN